MKVKLHLNWKKIVLFLLVSAGLIFLTHSLLMSIGIVMILFVADALIANYEYRQQTHRLFEDIRREHDQRVRSGKENS